MCIFSNNIESVSQTKIFARTIEADKQLLIYSMDISSRSETAMILPLPTRVGSGDDALSFISMENYPTFFADMEQGFLSPTPWESLLGLTLGHADTPLKVHKVGLFEASYVPSHNDWNRLDQRFQLPADTWKAIPQYEDYGFAVFRLNPTKAESGEIGLQTIHPMAFQFPRRNPEELFFPTVHIHDGLFHDHAQFDHILYCQCEPQETKRIKPFNSAERERNLRKWEADRLNWHWTSEENRQSFAERNFKDFWKKSPQPIDQFIDMEKAQGLIHPDWVCYRAAMSGQYDNEDTIL